MRISLLLPILVASAAHADPQPPGGSAAAALGYTTNVSRVIDADSGVVAATIDAAIRVPATSLDKCKITPKPLVAWLVFDRGKVALADVGGVDDAVIRSCIAGALKKAALPATTPRVVALVEVVAKPRTFAKNPIALEKIESIDDKSKLTVGTGAVDGSLTSAEINAVIRAKAAAIRTCYQNELKKSPALEGKIVVVFTIGADGNVPSVAVKQSTMTGGDAVVACIRSEIAKLKFPAKPGGARVSYPFVFTQGG